MSETINNCDGTVNVSAAQLRQFVERIERLSEDKKGIAEDIGNVFGEAKGTGFDTPTIKAIIKLRALEKATRQTQEALLETYKSALGIV